MSFLKATSLIAQKMIPIYLHLDQHCILLTSQMLDWQESGDDLQSNAWPRTLMLISTWSVQHTSTTWGDQSSLEVLWKVLVLRKLSLDFKDSNNIPQKRDNNLNDTTFHVDWPVQVQRDSNRGPADAILLCCQKMMFGILEEAFASSPQQSRTLKLQQISYFISFLF